MSSFEGKTALVTGGAAGIGRAVAEAFAGAGGNVIVADIDRERAEATAGEIGGGSFAIGLNVTDVSSIGPAIRAAADRTGRIDVLVNAALFGMEPLLEVTTVGFDRLFGVNVRGLFFTLQAAARLMVEDGLGGAIVNMASQAGRRGEAASSVYAATKAAVISLTQSAALALVDRNVRVNAVAPGVVDTEMWDTVDALHARQFGLAPGQRKREIAAAVPSGRFGRPDEIARAVLFLASADAEYVIGQTLNVDGGNVLS